MKFILGYSGIGLFFRQADFMVPQQQGVFAWLAGVANKFAKKAFMQTLYLWM